MSGILIIDTNSVGFAAHEGRKLTAGGQETQAIFGTLRTIRNLIVSHRDHKVICLWDGRSWRKDELGTYKGTRDDDPKKLAIRSAYKAQRPFIAKALTSLAVTQMMASNMEADDLAGILWRKFRAERRPIKMITRDGDWLQFVGSGVVSYDTYKDLTVSLGNFEQVTGYRNADAFVQGKALRGDVGDNIGGVGGIGDVGAKQILAAFGTVEDFIAAVEGGDRSCKKKWLDFVDNATGGRDIFQRNMRLMDLRRQDLPKPERLTITKGAVDRARFATLCAELAFHSILADLPKWVGPFEHERIAA
ncbi:hypothetical protein [Inquilinus sp. OTU3971]|uniref:hypothetical protein n=1 Tax=Inquilinus sp. OTU3971 TaxID=3043855 RepID=UPI00313B7AF1